MRIVIALGGNALLRRNERPDADIQQHHIDEAVAALRDVIARNEVIITHGNGPQVGLLAVESAADPALSRPYPFDALGAQTQGMIGYWLTQSLGNALSSMQSIALITQTIVRSDDKAFGHPTKFVGPVYEHEEADRKAQEFGWKVAQDGEHWRRVVASPEPIAIVELPVIKSLVETGVIVVCAGGGGVPVITTADGTRQGVEAVVDKDLTSAMLAEALEADHLMLLTDVAAIEMNFGHPNAQAIRSTTPADLRKLQFAAGSMGPKVEAACRFVEHTGRVASVGALTDVASILTCTAGTTIAPPHAQRNGH